MVHTKEDVARLARKPSCPRCDFNKTAGHALCSKCRKQLPPHMRGQLEAIPEKEPFKVAGALRAAANYFSVHFQSVRNFGGGRKR